jgi:alkylhydroperoxidase family enzyme
MKPRLNPYAVAPDLTKLLFDFGTRIAQAGLEPGLVELVKIRASQINGCARCLHMHTRDARHSTRCVPA